jgi:hypothetical protein
MTVLARARALRYDVGSNLKGEGVGAAWIMVLPRLDFALAEIIGRVTDAERAAVNRLTGSTNGRAQSSRPDGGSPGLLVVGRANATGGLQDAIGSAAALIADDGAAFATTERGGRILAKALPNARWLHRWPAVGPMRVLVPADDQPTAQRLVALGFLPPRGSTPGVARLLERLTSRPSGGAGRHGMSIVAGPAQPSAGPPRYVVDAAEAAGVDIRDTRWALVAPGDYASQKVLLLLFDEADRAPRTVVKLSADPAHASRLRNEAIALEHLASLGTIASDVPSLRFAGEHAGHGIVGQSWVSGTSFTAGVDPDDRLRELDRAAAWLTTLASLTVEHRPAEEIGSALRELLERFRAIHDLPADELMFLDGQVRAVEAHSGTLPVIFQHGDPGIWNLFVADDGQVSFLDWESAERHGLPIWDLAHLQWSFGAWASKRAGEPRRLPGSVRHLTTRSDLHARFQAQIATLSTSVDLPPTMVRPLFYSSWVHRSLKEATRRRPDTLHRGLYLRVLRELIRRRDEVPLRSLLGEHP